MSDTTPQLDPKRTALLVMDYQPGILERVEDPDSLAARARKAIEAMRAAGAAVGYVRVAFTDEEIEGMPETAGMSRVRQMPRDSMHVDSPATQVDPRVAPEPGDIVVRKVRVGAFSTTDLDAQLRQRGIDTLVLAGISTSGVLLSTVRDAYDRDYRMFVLGDASADLLPGVHEFLLDNVLARQAEVIEVADLAGLLG